MKFSFGLFVSVSAFLRLKAGLGLGHEGTSSSNRERAEGPNLLTAQAGAKEPSTELRPGYKAKKMIEPRRGGPNPINSAHYIPIEPVLAEAKVPFKIPAIVMLFLIDDICLHRFQSGLIHRKDTKSTLPRKCFKLEQIL